MTQQYDPELIWEVETYPLPTIELHISTVGDDDVLGAPKYIRVRHVPTDLVQHALIQGNDVRSAQWTAIDKLTYAVKIVERQKIQAEVQKKEAVDIEAVLKQLQELQARVSNLESQKEATQVVYRNPPACKTTPRVR